MLPPSCLFPISSSTYLATMPLPARESYVIVLPPPCVASASMRSAALRAVLSDATSAMLADRTAKRRSLAGASRFVGAPAFTVSPHPTPHTPGHAAHLQWSWRR